MSPRWPKNSLYGDMIWLMFFLTVWKPSNYFMARQSVSDKSLVLLYKSNWPAGNSGKSWLAVSVKVSHLWYVTVSHLWYVTVSHLWYVTVSHLWYVSLSPMICQSLTYDMSQSLTYDMSQSLTYDMSVSHLWYVTVSHLYHLISSININTISINSITSTLLFFLLFLF